MEGLHSDTGHSTTLPDTYGKYTEWAAIAAEESEMELEEMDIEALLGIGEVDIRPWNATHEVYDVARRMMFIAAFKRAAQVMIEQALTLDSLESELTRAKHEARQDHDQREKRLRLAESQARLFREEADKSSTAVEHLRSQVSSLLAEKQGWSRNDAGIIPLDDHEQVVQRLQEESRRRIDSIEAEKGHIAFQLSRLRLQLAQAQSQTVGQDYREDLLDILAEKLKIALARDEEQSNIHARETELALAVAESNVANLRERLQATDSAREHAEENAARSTSMYESLEQSYNEVRERFATLEEAHNRLVESTDENVISDLRNEAERLKTSLTETEMARDKAISEKESLQSLSNEIQAELEAKAREIQELKEHTEHLSAELSSVKIERDSAQSDVRSSESARKSLEQQLGEVKSQITTLEKERDVALLDAEQLKLLLDEANKHVADGKEEFRLQTDALKDAQLKVDQALKENENIRSDLSTAKADYEGLKANAITITQAYVSLQAEHQSATLEASELRKTLDELLVQQTKATEEHRLKIEENRTELRNLRNQHAQSVEELERTKSALSNAKSDLARANSTKDEMQKRVQEAEENSRKAANDLLKASKTIEEAESRRDDLRKLSETLRADLEAKQLIVDKLEKAASLKQKQCEKLDEEKNLVKEELRLANADLSTKNKRLLESSASLDAMKKELELSKTSLSENIELLRQTLLKSAADRTTFNSELDQVKKGLMEAVKQHHEAVRDNERLRLNLADAVASQADDAQKIRDENAQKLRKLKDQLVAAEARLKATEQQNEKLHSDLRSEKAALVRAQGLIERQEAARQRMAAIYGLPTNSPLHSPDRPVPHMSFVGSTPSSSPPASTIPLNAVLSEDRLSKRARFARATWPNIETTTPTTASPTVQPTLMLHPASGDGASLNNSEASSSSRLENLGTSADTAIPLDIDDDVEDVQVSPIQDLAITEQRATADSPTAHENADADGKTQNSGATKRKRKEGRVTRSATYRSRRRRTGTNEDKLSDEQTGTDGPSILIVRDTLPPTTFQSSEVAEYKRPTLLESYPNDFTLGPNVWAVWGRLARLASWKETATSHFLCGFCRIEDRFRDGVKHPPLDFDPFWQSASYWKHCMEKHRSAFRGDAEQRVIGYPTLLDQSQGYQVENNEYTKIFADFVSWKAPHETFFTCGLCTLESTVKHTNVRHPLDFNSWHDSTHFFAHCRSEHGPFWGPDVSKSVHLVPDYVASLE